MFTISYVNEETAQTSPIQYYANCATLKMNSSNMEETKLTQKSRRGRFLRVAERRTRNVLIDLVRLANCGNRAAYEYSEADVKKIFDAIELQLEVTRSRFKTNQKKEITFSFDE